MDIKEIRCEDGMGWDGWSWFRIVPMVEFVISGVQPSDSVTKRAN